MSCQATGTGSSSVYYKSMLVVGALAAVLVFVFGMLVIGQVDNLESTGSSLTGAVGTFFDDSTGLLMVFIVAVAFASFVMWVLTQLRR